MIAGAGTSRPTAGWRLAGFATVAAAGLVAQQIIAAAQAPIDLVWANLVNAAFYMVAFLLSFRRRLSYVDISLLFIFVVLLYISIPLLVFDAFGLRFSSVTDNRLYSMPVTMEALRTVTSLGNLIMTGFGLGYIFVRRGRMLSPPVPQPGDKTTLTTTFAVAALIVLIVGLAAQGASYADSYLFYASLPPIVATVLNAITALFAASIFGLVALQAATTRGYSYLLVCLAALVVALVASESRTMLFVVVLSTIVATDHFRRRFALWQITALAVIAVAAFSILGLIRGDDEFAAIAGRSEFMSIFVTALDILIRSTSGEVTGVVTDIATADLFRLIPQVLLPFDKFEPSVWYVTNFYPDVREIGGGFAFGMMAQAIILGGEVPAIVGSLLLGMGVAAAINYLTRRRSIFTTVTYIWLLTFVYLSFRDTAFTLGGRFVYQFLPSLVLIWATRWFINRAIGATSPVRGSQPLYPSLGASPAMAGAATSGAGMPSPGP